MVDLLQEHHDEEWYGSIYQNVVVKWINSDNEKTFNNHYKNLDTRRELEKLGYDKESITYDYNAFGFRTKHFHNKGNSIVFLGCSHTEGVGLRYEDTYASVVSREIGLHSINLGVSGGAMDTTFRLAYYWLPKLKPTFVVHQQPHQGRYEFFLSNDRNVRPIKLIPNLTDGPKFLRTWYMWHLKSDRNYSMNFEKNQHAVKNICNELNIEYISLERPKLWDITDFGRDLMHYGVETHKKVAQGVIQKIKEAM